MNNIKKIGLSALAGSLASFSAHAVDVSLSGEVQVVHSSAEGNGNGLGASNGRGLSNDQDILVTASGELDNGWTVSSSLSLNTGTAVSNSSSQISVGMGSMGTLMFANTLGTQSNAIDDVLPKAYEEVWDGTSHTENFSDFGSHTHSGTMEYRTPAFEMMGMTISASAAYDSAAGVGAAGTSGVAAGSQRGEAYTIKLAHDSGLTLGGGNMKVGNTAARVGESAATGYAKYSNGGLTVGYQESEIDAPTATDSDESQMFGISYAVTDSFSIAYSESSFDLGSTTTDQESDGISASYTMGGITVAGAMNSTENIAGDTNTTADKDAYEMSISFAF